MFIHEIVADILGKPISRFQFDSDTIVVAGVKISKRVFSDWQTCHIGGLGGRYEHFEIEICRQNYSAATMIVKVHYRVHSFATLLSGLDPRHDRDTLAHMTQILGLIVSGPAKPSFEVFELEKRPLIAAFHWKTPPHDLPQALELIRYVAAEFFDWALGGEG